MSVISVSQMTELMLRKVVFPTLLHKCMPCWDFASAQVVLTLRLFFGLAVLFVSQHFETLQHICYTVGKDPPSPN